MTYSFKYVRRHSSSVVYEANHIQNETVLILACYFAWTAVDNLLLVMIVVVAVVVVTVVLVTG